MQRGKIWDVVSVFSYLSLVISQLDNINRREGVRWGSIVVINCITIMHQEQTPLKIHCLQCDHVFHIYTQCDCTYLTTHYWLIQCIDSRFKLLTMWIGLQNTGTARGHWALVVSGSLKFISYNERCFLLSLPHSWLIRLISFASCYSRPFMLDEIRRLKIPLV